MTRQPVLYTWGSEGNVSQVMDPELFAPVGGTVRSFRTYLGVTCRLEVSSCSGLSLARSARSQALTVNSYIHERTL